MANKKCLIHLTESERETLSQWAGIARDEFFREKGDTQKILWARRAALLGKTFRRKPCFATPLQIKRCISLAGKTSLSAWYFQSRSANKIRKSFYDFSNQMSGRIAERLQEQSAKTLRQPAEQGAAPDPLPHVSPTVQSANR